jgi:hypothetical protein
MALIQCCACQQEVPDRAELCPYCGAEPIKVRGLWTIAVFAAIGLVLGTLGGAVWLAVRHANGANVGPVAETIFTGTCWGTIAGGVIGALYWAFFPYKSGSQPAPEQDEQVET